MREGVHPEYTKITATCSCGNVMLINSTLKEDLNLDVCSSCHPFYTGKQKLVDTSGRVEKFEKRFGKKDKVNKTQTKDQEETTSDEEVKGEVAETSVKQSATKESENKKSKEKKETKDQEETTSDEEVKGEVAETSVKQSATKESENKKSKEKKETKDSPKNKTKTKKQ